MKQPKPFFRKQTGSWYVQIKKRQIRLGKDKKAAWVEYHKLMGGARELSPREPLAQVVDEFLDWVKSEKADSTYKYYQRHLKSFVEHVGYRMPISQLRPIDVTQWIKAKYSGWGETSRHSVISTVQRAMSWASKQGIIERSTIAGMEKPTKRQRETFVSADQYAMILASIKDSFRDVVETLWETGCRIQELRKVEARHYIPERGVWLFDRVESKGKKKRRLVVLNEKARAITERLCKANPVGPIFRNTRGRNPWTKDAINCRFSRLKEKLNFPTLSAYEFRHGFATAALENGVPAISVAQLMGHCDGTRMLETVYQHTDSNDSHLRGALKIKDAEA